jgi:integrase
VSVLSQHAQDYLAIRRTLGFKLEFAGRVLPQFVAFVESRGASTVTVEHAVAWAGLPQGSVQPISLSHRLGAVRGFARWLQAIDPDTEVPPPGIWPSSAPRPEPYLWSDAEVSALMDAAGRLRHPLRAATLQALFGLLATTGMRVGEALRLDRDDVDVDEGVITIREAKFARDRVVPLHPSVSRALGAYVTCRDRLCPARASNAFFVSTVGSRLGYGGVHPVFVRLTTAIGLRPPARRPRLHDLRHSFAVRTLLNWHRAGVDVGARMVRLSNYLGHVNPAGTFWYLSAAPELMELVASRLQPQADGRP